MNVFELFAKLGLDTSEYDKGLDDSEQKGSNFGQKLGKAVSTGAKVATAALAATTAATVAGAKAFTSGVANVAQYGDNIEKTSQKLGISVTKFQEWDYVMNIAGTSMNNMTMGMKTMTNQLDNAKNGSADALAKFEALGLSLEDIQSMSREEIFEASIRGFQQMSESTERAALANDLFGRSGQELTPLFNMTNEETQKLIATANEYGMVLSEDAVNASATFKDSLTTMNNTMTGLKNGMLSEFLPSFTLVMDGLSAIFAGDDSGLGKIDEGVNNFIENLNKVMPRVVQIGSRILTTLIRAISSNLPKLLKQGSGVLKEFISGIIVALPSLLESGIMIVEMVGSALIDNAGLLLDSAISLVMKLGDSLVKNAPVIIPAIVMLITTIITTLTSPENLNAFISGALQLIMALADGIVLALPQLVSVIPVIIGNLTQALIDNAPMVLETVLYLIGALAIAVVSALASLFGSSLDEVANGLGDIFMKIANWGKSVLSWFTNIGTNIKKGVTTFFSNVSGFFTSGFENIRQKVTDGLEAVKTKFTTIFENVKNIVKNAIDKLKSFFKFDWSLPKIKLPHFKISGSFSLNPPKIPTFSVSWYKKAMEEPYLLNNATIFGAANGRLLGGGEAGSELVVGTNKLMSMIRQATGVQQRPIEINVYGAEGQDIRELAKLVGEEFTTLMRDEEKAYGFA